MTSPSRGGDALDVPTAGGAERLRETRRTLSDAARDATPEAAGILGGAALAISAHEAVISAIDDVTPGPAAYGAQAAIEASAMMWVAAGAQAACVVNLVSGPTAAEADATAKMTR